MFKVVLEARVAEDGTVEVLFPDNLDSDELTSIGGAVIRALAANGADLETMLTLADDLVVESTTRVMGGVLRN